MASIGILGGTFNPPHLGHLAVARAARGELGLDRVLLMPVHTPPHKPAATDPGPEHRLAMCRLLADSEPGVEACDLEVGRGGPSYTADTLDAIHAGHPEAELTFIVGADTARTLPSWREPAKVLALARLAVAAREGAERGEVLAAVESLAAGAAGARGGGDESGVEPRVAFLTMDPIVVSSSLARARAVRGEPLEDLLGTSVASYVHENRLYEGG